MALPPRRFRTNFEDFCWLVGEDKKADLIDGVIYPAAPEFTATNQLALWLLGVFFHAIDGEEERQGQVHSFRVGYKLSNYDCPEPDLSFMRKERLHLDRVNHYDGPPDLVMELVAPDSIERDYKTKKHLYEKAGVEEYWIIDQLIKKATLYRLGEDGRYRRIPARNGVLTSRVIRGLDLKIKWLWTESRTRTSTLEKRARTGKTANESKVHVKPVGSWGFR